MQKNKKSPNSGYFNEIKNNRLTLYLAAMKSVQESSLVFPEKMLIQKKKHSGKSYDIKIIMKRMISKQRHVNEKILN